MSGFLRDCIYGKQSADYHKNDVQTLKTPSILDITPACHLIEEEEKKQVLAGDILTSILAQTLGLEKVLPLLEN